MLFENSTDVTKQEDIVIFNSALIINSEESHIHDVILKDKNDKEDMEQEEHPDEVFGNQETGVSHSDQSDKADNIALAVARNI